MLQGVFLTDTPPNKLASLGATLVRNSAHLLTYLLTHSLTGVKCRATSVAKNIWYRKKYRYRYRLTFWVPSHTASTIEEHQLVSPQQHQVESHFQLPFLPVPPLSPARSCFPSKSFSGRETFEQRGLSCQGWRRRRGQAWPPCQSPSAPWGRAGPWAGPRSEPTCGGKCRRG